MRFRKTALIGVGLLGGSLGLALRERRLSGSVHGFARRPETVSECLQRGVIDHGGCDLHAAVDGADLVVLCTPVGTMRSLVDELAPALAPGALVTDVGSVKGILVRELEPLLTRVGAHFVGSHPMAGSEQTGVAAARSGLFQGAVCAVTPTSDTEPEALRRVRGLWEAVGCDVLLLDPDLHDALVGRTSHLPHVVAAALAGHVLDPARPDAQARLCAGGFRDTTRIASGSPVMWTDIVLANREVLLGVLGEFAAELEAFREILRSRDGAAVRQFFERGRERREHWMTALRSVPPSE